MKCRSLVILLALCLTVGATTCSLADQSVTSGEFIDFTGAHHLWHINSDHALIWGGQPWIPAGGTFQSKYLTGPQTGSTWAADVAALAILKKHGIRSIILQTSSDLDLVTDLNPSDFQKVLDYLDSQGFQYGIQLSSFPRDPLEAIVVNPAVYRVLSPASGATLTFKNLQGLVGAKYYLVSEADGSVAQSGDATVVDTNTASVTIDTDKGGLGSVLLLYPRCVFTSDSLEGQHLPDIWGKADQYRDDLLLYLSKLKFGSGLRFFVDPVVEGFGFYGDADQGAIPDSDNYRLQFQIWLQTHYDKSLAKLNEAWGVRNQDVFDFAAASRSLPLWYQSKGIQLLSDPVSAKNFVINAEQSVYWSDVREFRIDSQRSVMNDLANSLKHGVADVPVIYRWTRPSRAYVDNVNSEGYDGLLVSSGEHGQLLATNAGGWALSAEEQSSRTEWLLGEIEPLSRSGSPGYISQAAYSKDSSILHQIGVKGFFVKSFQSLSDTSSLLNAPLEQLDWIAADQALFDQNSDTYCSFMPNFLFYPLNLELPSTTVRQFDDGTWWLPSYAVGTQINIGRDLECYHMRQPQFGESLVLWSPGGTVNSAQFALPKNSLMRAYTPSDQVVTLLLKKNVYTCPTSKTPVVVQGVTTLPLVADAPVSEMVEANRLLSEGKSEGIPLDSYSQRLYYIQNEVYGDGTGEQAQTAYPMLVALNDDLQNALSPFAWVEGEAATTQTLGTIVTSQSASGGAFLWQDTPDPPSSGTQYSANYTLNTGAPGDYTVWASLAPGPPGVGSTSQLSYSLDNGTAYDVNQPDGVGGTYGTVLDAASFTRTGSFSWYDLGTINLSPGQHTLNFIETGPAPTTGRYTLGIDAICLTRASFIPDGATKPFIH